ncbi:MAG: primosomal protein N' [Clostridiales bacterium]|jgi:primosomal protein N' (replication factor Y)|nr:primosomal protein N' [Clostridiales bacterium]
MTAYAGIAADIYHSDLDKIFYYRVPEDLRERVHIGSMVIVPFGRGDKRLEGYVTCFSQNPGLPDEKIKSILEVRGDKPFFTPKLLELARWMSEKYNATLISCIKRVAPRPSGFRSGKIKRAYIREDASRDAVLAEIERLRAKSSSGRDLPGSGADPPQAKILELLLECDGADVNDVKNELGISASPIKTLVKNGFITLEEDEAEAFEFVRQDEKPKLTESQQDVLRAVNRAADAKKPILIHGVTGSGKTEIYMRIIEDVIAKNRQAITLVPEIALTPQMAGLFLSRFGRRAAVTHSRLSAGERFDIWKKAKNDEISVVIGPRSAVFAPFDRLGAIIIDEEHEKTYVSETTPKYSALEVARKRAEIEDALVVLGSATPRLESYFQAENGEMDLAVMTRRVKGKLPEIYVVDMRAELSEGNMSVFSRPLFEALEETLSRGKQAVLFLNRRGFATFVSCRKCGFVMKCDECNVSYTYHISGEELVCHYCGKKTANPSNCPQCGSKYIRRFGAGTQRVEQDARKLFPSARALRMDSDTVTRRSSYENMLSLFRENGADILIGTQMIAKGLDFPNVTLVGVMAADVSLNSGDFRCAETTFQLLSQVAGRAGRAADAGQAFIQTYNPEHYSVVYARRNDYESFYRYELDLRRQMGYPPYTSLFCALFCCADEKRAISLLAKLAEIMRGASETFDVIGPSPAYISKIRGMYRWKIIVKGENELELKEFAFQCVRMLKERENLSGVDMNLTMNPISLA